MPGLPCHALPCLACCHQRRIWVKNGRILEKNAKCLAKTSKKHANWNVRQVEQLLLLLERSGGKRGGTVSPALTPFQ